jgi:putative aldouronate transport system substrate-binding protein
MVASGEAAATFGNALSVSSLQEALSSVVPGASLACVPVTGPGGTYIEGNGGSALCIASGSRNPDRAMEFLNWVYAGQDHYDLICYGEKGKNYLLAGEGITLISDSYKSFPSEMFANVNYMRFTPEMPEETMETIRHWNDGASISPLGGFVFNATNVQAETDQAKALYAIYGKLLFTGSSDSVVLLNEFGARLKAAGQDKIVAEAQAQVNAYLLDHK